MTQTENDAAWPDLKPTALLVLADGTVLEGFGLGAEGHAVGEVCFNTAMTGYEEILTDPSYAGQIITFTFPHIGNVGTNEEDIESVNMAAATGARGVIMHSAITPQSNYRATKHLNDWLKARGIIGLCGIDTRALTTLIRVNGMPNAVIAHEPSGKFDLPALKKEAKAWPGLVGMDLVPMVTSAQRFSYPLTQRFAQALPANANCAGVPGISEPIDILLRRIHQAQAAGEGILAVEDVLIGVTEISPADHRALAARGPIKLTKRDESGGEFVNSGPQPIAIQGVFASTKTFFKIAQTVRGRYLLSNQGVTLFYDFPHIIQLGQKVLGVTVFKILDHSVVSHDLLSLYFQKDPGQEPDRCYVAVGDNPPH